MESNSISKMLAIVLVLMIVILFVLVITYIIVTLKNKNKSNVSKKGVIPNQPKTKENNKEQKAKASMNTLLPKRSIFEFMEFEDVKDNMIIQKNGKRYLAVIECMGVNYDLMSKMEKNAVEEGFQQFLNTLRHPIQIYIQTRTMNLGKSIQTYKDKLKNIEDKYNKTSREYARMQESEAYSQEDLNKYKFEVTRNRNLLEYGKDIIANTERMSLNKNVLTKKYYIIIPYFPEDVDKYDKEEIRNMAFSELYTKAQSIISTLAGCSVSGRMLDSQELVELLYMSYNREEAEIYGLDRALEAEYDSLYSTAPDVFEQKIKLLDERIKESARTLAEEAVEQAKSIPQEKAEEKEKNIDELIKRLASRMIKDNEKQLGEKVTNEAIKIVQEEGGEENVPKKKQTRRRTNK